VAETKHEIVTTEPSVDNAIFWPAVITVAAISLFLILAPDVAGPTLTTVKKFVTGNFGWLFLLLTFGALIFAGWLAFGPYGNVKLGARDEKPEYSTVHWIAMMFTCGVGAGLVVWGFAEPLFYLATPPVGIEAGSTQAVEFAHMYPLFHWGISSWAIYAVPAVPIAYLLYVRKKPVLRVSAACEDSLPKAGRDVVKTIIDIFIIFGIIGGSATALGLGIPMASALVAEFTGLENDIYVKLGMLALWATLFSFSVYRGLKRGIKILADVNLVLALLAISFIFIVGPTLYILKLSVNSVGVFLNNFTSISLWTDPVLGSSFPEDWTVFYWTWYLAFTAFVGLFIARISRGRTIRQLIVGVLTWGTLGTSLFLMVMGGYALHLNEVCVAAKEAGNACNLDVVATLKDQGMFVLTAKILAGLPAGKAVLFLFIILSTIFYATNVDSAAYVMSSISSKNLQSHQEPPRSNRLVWALLLSLITAGLVMVDKVSIIQSATIISALPLVPIVILMCVSLVRWLNADFGHTKADKILTIDDQR